MNTSNVWASLLVGYLLGSFPSADIVSWLATRGRVDLRSSGSGNPGGFNAIREVGKAWGVVVITLDLAKGVAAGFIGGYPAATAAVAGHIFPPWTRFRGGKGVATFCGAVLAVFPGIAALAVLILGVTTAIYRSSWRTVVVGGVVVVAGAIVWFTFGIANLWGPAPRWGLIAFTTTCTGLVLGKFLTSARGI